MLASIFAQYVLPILGTTASSLVVYGLSEVIKWVRSKTKNENTIAIVSRVQDAVTQAVLATEQTIVSQLKSSGQWNTNGAKSQALSTALATAKSILGPRLKEIAITGVTDIESYLRSAIEAKLQIFKSK